MSNIILILEWVLRSRNLRYGGGGSDNSVRSWGGLEFNFPSFFFNVFM